MLISFNFFDSTNNIKDFLLFSHHFLTFQYLFLMLLIWLLRVAQKMVYYQVMHKNLWFLLMACRIIVTIFEWKNKQPINVSKISDQSFRLLFFGCVVTTDLYLFEEIVHLNLCLMFSKSLMLSFIGTKI